MPVHIPLPNQDRNKRVVDEKQVRKILREADVNNDNHLSWSELQKALKKLGARLPPYRAWRCLRNADANNDGRISPSEMDNLVRYIMNWYNA
ncbi:uncharacterized protein LOC114729689 [Neltuma alba]|uniref:uncharacterized protein LOC114729689 n=1 Tax=Neltuma alba TaxID=207710 RepID=UPI0010A54A0E|nr:uncharacterized protein LOC114729689 [Prosopis alba]